MSVRQYIGARYVPKFYDGTNGSAWDTGVQYEPLTIVGYANNYYVSKKTVPSTVGAPNVNPDYWANIGLFSDLESRIADVENDVSQLEPILSQDLRGKKVAFFGDSITYGVTVTGGVVGRTDKPFPEWFADVTGATVTNYAVSGATMSQPGGTWSFIDQIGAFDYSQFDYIVLFFGYNDVGKGVKPYGTSNQDGFGYAYTNAIEYIQQANKNAKIILCTLPYTTTFDSVYGENGMTDRSANQIIYDVARRYSLPVIDLAYESCNNPINNSFLKGDGLHYTDNGYKQLGAIFANLFPGVTPKLGQGKVDYKTVTVPANGTASATMSTYYNDSWSFAILMIAPQYGSDFGIYFVTPRDITCGIKLENSSASLIGGLGAFGDCNIAVDTVNTNNKQLVINFSATTEKTIILAGLLI